MSYISVKQVGKQYKMGEVTIDAIKDINFEIDRGQVAIIVGPSGAGKTTILNILGGMDSCDSGSIVVDGTRISELSMQKLTNYRRNQIGFVFQFYNLVQNLTALENVELAVAISTKEDEVKRLMRHSGFKLNHNPKDITEREQARLELGEQLATQIVKKNVSASEMLDQVGLSHRKDHFPSQLSGGEQQRVAIARALGKTPKLLLCDEPTGALDYVTGKAILTLLQEIAHKRNMTVVIITHNTAITPMADLVIHVKNGTVEQVQTNDNPTPVAEIEW